MSSAEKGINVIIKINDVPVAGQLNAQISQTMSSIDITNKINAEWGEHLSGLKEWRINCSGIYIKNASAFAQLEDAFLNNTLVQVSFAIGGKTYEGNAYIVEFPLNNAFDIQLKYNLALLGDGALHESQ